MTAQIKKGENTVDSVIIGIEGADRDRQSNMIETMESGNIEEIMIDHENIEKVENIQVIHTIRSKHIKRDKSIGIIKK